MASAETGPPVVTVIMPTYDQEAFIPRATRSLLAQVFTDWELIVVDDGSPGDTASIIDCTDSRIRYHRLPENRGLGAALNVGLELARGRFIAYLPSDDIYYSDHLASLVKALQADPEAAMTYSGVRHHYNHMAEGRIPGYPIKSCR